MIIEGIRYEMKGVKSRPSCTQSIRQELADRIWSDFSALSNASRFLVVKFRQCSFEVLMSPTWAFNGCARMSYEASKGP